MTVERTVPESITYPGVVSGSGSDVPVECVVSELCRMVQALTKRLRTVECALEDARDRARKPT